MVSRLEIECPYCGSINDCNNDNWKDEFMDDSGPTEVDCFECGKTILVESKIEIRLHVIKDEPEN